MKPPEKLLKKLKDPSPRVRSKALQELTDTNYRGSQNIAIGALNDRSPMVRATALESLTCIGNETALPDVVKLLSDPNAEVRMMAAEAFGALSKPGKSPKTLISLLEDKDELVRVAAAESLGLIGDRRALPKVREALYDKSALVRSYAAPAVGQLGSRKDRRLLTSMLRTEKDEIARVGFLTGLYGLGERESLTELLNLMSKANDYRARCAAANTLAELRLTKTERRIVIDALRRALRREPTVASRSSIRSTLQELE
jgi:HEAT repeat protein